MACVPRSSESPIGMAPSTINAAVTCVWPVGAVLGEGPCWDPRCARLVFVDIRGGMVHALSPETGAFRSWRTAGRICSVGVPGPGWQAPGGFGDTPYLCCGDEGFAWLSLEDETPRLVHIAHPEMHLAENRFNDGKMGPDARFWAGTMHDPETLATGTLYAFAANGQLQALDSGYAVANGPAFSPDGTTVYHTDSARQTIYAFTIAAKGQLVDKRVFLLFGTGEGHPDGMTTDAEGNLWVAMWDGARIEKVSPLGERLGAVQMPTPRVTSCTFGPDERTLYVTSARIGLSQPDDVAGGLFRVVL